MQRKQLWIGIPAAVIMLIMILDTKTVLSSAQSGIELCLRTVIPSLFPFIVISIVMSSNLTGVQLNLLRPIGILCGMPAGTETLFLLGILGGYPVGAQCIYNAYHNSSIPKQAAKRLLGFCSNAGPAFIFGMTGNLFQSAAAPWALWGIHILSALFVGFVLPEKNRIICQLSQKQEITIPHALEKGIKAIGKICGWIVLFRILIGFFKRWFLWLLPQTMQICLIAALELSNGCCEIYGIGNQGLRFIICSGMLAFGGICVFMQTSSVTKELGTGMYFPGKILQTVISVLLAAITQNFLFPTVDCIDIDCKQSVIVAIIGLIFAVRFLSRKKVVAFSDRLVYNNSKFLQS